MKNDTTDIVIFCDGACSGNPGPGGWGSVILWRSGRIEELGGGSKQTTNNQMELSALLFALRRIKTEKSSALILMDSVYVLMGATEWWKGWKFRGWKTASGEPVANKETWEELIEELSHFSKGQLKFGHVRGHAGIPGNERADKIAVAFSQGLNFPLEKGKMSSHHQELFNYPENIDIPEMKWERGEKKVAHSYLSYVNGVAQRHSSWAECEARVKGKSGAKFKKAMSPEEEKEILASWGAKL